MYVCTYVLHTYYIHTYIHTYIHECKLEASHPKMMLSRGCGHTFLYHRRGRVVVQECLDISCFLRKERWQVVHTNGLSDGGAIIC